MTSKEKLEAKMAYQETLRQSVKSYQEIAGLNMLDMSTLIKMNNGTFKSFMLDIHQTRPRTIQLIEKFLTKQTVPDHECCCCMKDHCGMD